MEDINRQLRVNGLSLAVFADGEVIYTYNHGYASRSADIPACDNTRYRSASVSKTATAICAMILHDRGLLDLDESVSKITGLNMDSRSQVAPNTTRHLLSHTSTIVDTSAYHNGWERGPKTAEQILRNGVFSSGEPGRRYQYSNFASGMVAAVIESITEQRFYAFAQENLFELLSMDAAYTRDLIEDVDSIANLYRSGRLVHNVQTWGRTTNLYDRIPLGQSWGLSECEMIISATDLARLGIIVSGDGSVDGIQVITTESVMEMRAPFMGSFENDLNNHVRGLGLRIFGNVVENRVITGHAGNALGMVGGLFFDCSDRTGVAILTNGCSGGVNENGMHRINDEIVKLVYEIFFD
jgi:CubicO group peptidase (beta-lactamase class C family)